MSETSSFDEYLEHPGEALGLCGINAGEVKFEADETLWPHDEEDNDTTNGACSGHRQGSEAAALSAWSDPADSSTQ